MLTSAAPECRDLMRSLSEGAARRYASAGRFAMHFARGKLGAERVLGEFLARGLIPRGAQILDLGCGQGLLAAWLLAAADCHRSGRWCAGWPPPPVDWRYRGIEQSPPEVRRARAALGAAAQVDAGDLRRSDYGVADVVVLLDVLHYMPRADQQGVLQKVRAALSAGGVLLLRIGDAGGGLRFRLSTWIDQFVAFARGRGWNGLHCRAVPEWLALLAGIGFDTDAIPMSEHTPFANVLLVARPR